MRRRMGRRDSEITVNAPLPHSNPLGSNERSLTSFALPPLVGQQIETFDRINRFLSAPSVERPYFVTHGLGGSGKSRLLIAVASEREGCVCAFTGKAASVISRKSGLDATTIHSAIYKFQGRYKDDRGRDQLSFAQRIEARSWNGLIIYVDECSMIPCRTARDLIDTGARLVVMGDPGQLPPVMEREQFFNEPDAMLTEIHRQAWGSPIIRQAHYVRMGYNYSPDTDDFQVKNTLTHEEIVSADIMLCFKNETRKALNTAKRAHLRLTGEPIPGEPVMCLRNNRDLGIMNGGVYMLSDYRYSGNRLLVSVINDDGYEVTVYDGWFEDVNEQAKDRNENAIGFAWAYAATVHKAQGSEFDRVILFDEYPLGFADRIQWQYTGISRAAKSIIIKC